MSDTRVRPIGRALARGEHAAVIHTTCFRNICVVFYPRCSTCGIVPECGLGSGVSVEISRDTAPPEPLSGDAEHKWLNAGSHPPTNVGACVICVSGCSLVRP